MTLLANTIKQFNSGRNPNLLTQKYKNMRADAFVFYRGSCHLFYQDLPADSFFAQAPASWICGDLHLENFGCYKADNRRIYFDINDFDEAVLAPCLFDVARLLTSIVLAADTLKVNESEAVKLCQSFTKNYAQILQAGTAQLMEENLAQGALKDFLQETANRKRKDFINSRTVKSDGKRRLLIDNKRIIQVDTAVKQQVTNAIDSWATAQKNPDFYRVLDVGYRIAGTGSLGLERYVLLLEGHGKDNHYLLDMKIANPSCVNPCLKLTQPAWKNEAERIVQIQKRMHIFPQALLNTIEFNQCWFVLKELQPTQDKMTLSLCKGNMKELDSIISTFAAIVGWDQLRSSGRQGSTTSDELIRFGSSVANWGEDLLDYSRNYAKQVYKDYQEYCEAYDAGYFHD